MGCLRLLLGWLYVVLYLEVFKEDIFANSQTESLLPSQFPNEYQECSVPPAVVF